MAKVRYYGYRYASVTATAQDSADYNSVRYIFSGSKWSVYKSGTQNYIGVSKTKLADGSTTNPIEVSTVEYRLLKEYESGSVGDAPDPFCDGYTFVKWYPTSDSVIRGVGSSIVKIGTEESSPTATLTKETAKPSVQPKLVEGVVHEKWSGTVDIGSDIVALSISYLDLTGFILSYKAGESETLTYTVEKATGDDSFELSGGIQINVKTEFINPDEEEEELPDVDIYALYEDNTCSLTYWYRDENGNVKYAIPSEVGPYAYGTIFDSAKHIPSDPSRSGLWTFKGWIPDPTELEGVSIVKDYTFEGIFTGQSNITIQINGDGATNYDYTRSVVCKWGDDYPTIQVLPSRTGYGLESIWLVKISDGTKVAKCYDGDGTSLATVNQSVLTDPTTRVLYELRAMWVASSIYNLDGLREAIGIVPEPFASEASSRVKIQNYLGVSQTAISEGSTLDTIKISDKNVSVKSGDSVDYGSVRYKFSGTEWNATTEDISIKDGLSDVYAQKLDDGGSVITRQIVNAIGNLGSQCQFFEQCGGYHTFESEVSDKIGGYPKNAFLQFYDESSNTLRTVVSLQDDNTYDFTSNGVDGEHWAYSDDNPEVGIEVDYSDFIDLGDTLFVETGLPDLYEVPYDSYLQMFALGSVDCSSLKRDKIEDILVNIGYTDPEDKEGTLIQDYINAMYLTTSQGHSYLDVYGKNDTVYGSVLIGGFYPFEWESNHPNNNLNVFKKLCPLSPFTGGVMLTKGDKIRVRNSFIDFVPDVLLQSETETYKISKKLFTDSIIKRNFLVRFANLYRRRVCI